MASLYYSPDHTEAVRAAYPQGLPRGALQGRGVESLGEATPIEQRLVSLVEAIRALPETFGVDKAALPRVRVDAERLLLNVQVARAYCGEGDAMHEVLDETERVARGKYSYGQWWRFVRGVTETETDSASPDGVTAMFGFPRTHLANRAMRPVLGCFGFEDERRAVELARYAATLFQNANATEAVHQLGDFVGNALSGVANAGDCPVLVPDAIWYDPQEEGDPMATVRLFDTMFGDAARRVKAHESR